LTNELVRKEFTVQVRTDLDLLAARRQTRTFVQELGFSATDVTGIVTAVSELARNMLMYAQGGDLTVRSIQSGVRRGVQVVARDRGPGIPDIRRALLDGYSTSGGLGMGLPGVRRLMDDFKIHSAPDGTVVDAKKWLNDRFKTERQGEMQTVKIGVSLRPIPGESSTGDRFLVQPTPHGLLFAVIDGLGHGAEAASVAETTVDVLKTNAASDLPALIESCHARLRGSRGAVMTLGALSPAGILRWVGIGNVLGVVVRAGSRPFSQGQDDSKEFLVGRGGVIGDRLPSFQVATMNLRRGDTVIIATDGVDQGFLFKENLDLEPQPLADRILDANAIDRDDSLVLVVRYLGGERGADDIRPAR